MSQHPTDVTTRWRRHPRAVAGLAAAAVAVVPVLALSSPSSGVTADRSAHHQDPYRVFSRSFVENPADHTVTLPRHQGVSHGEKVTYVITDASTSAAARRLGVNYAPRLANAAGTAAVQSVHRSRAGLVFPATIDFSPVRVVVPGPTGFPPVQADPGAIGEPGYSALVQLPDGVVLNAPQVANDTGNADKVVSNDAARGRVVYRETDGFYDHHPVHYVSFEASIPLTAALENAALSPNLNAAPGDFPGEPAPTAREEIGIVTNGQLGADNPQRQGLSSALLDGLDPLNLLGEVPEEVTGPSDYSPLWDANLAQWTPAAVAAGLDRRQTAYDDLVYLARKGLITAPDGGPFRRSDFVIDCPAISILR